MRNKLFLLLLLSFLSNISFAQFITTWETTHENQQIIIPTNWSEYNYNYSVNWGDGNSDSNLDKDASHVYTTKGVYTITITGDFPAIYFGVGGSRLNIKTIEQWGNNPWKSMHRAFVQCENLSINATDSPNLSNVTDMSFMFMNAGVNQSLNNWDVSNVLNMEYLFHNSDFNNNISNWNVSNVITMENMFFGTNFNQNISGWNVSNVRNMKNMFAATDFFNQDISNWNVSNVENMEAMFDRTKQFNQNIGAWNVSSVKNMASMFRSSPVFNQDISNWNVRNVLDMSGMFSGAIVFNQNLGTWNVSSVTDMSNMFNGAHQFNQDIGTWDVSKVTKMNSMFRDTYSFNRSIGNWNVGNVIDMDSMFRGSRNDFNQDISNWNTEKVIDMDNMFRDNRAFNQDISNWNISLVNSMRDMLNNTSMSRENYDKLLKGWASQNVQTNVRFGALNLTYCVSEQERTILTSQPNNWNISGDARDCDDIALIPDTNFEQYLIDENIDSDATINGLVLKTDVATIENINVNDKNISDLTGIEAFKSLKVLSANNNQITSIDISNNLSLEELFITNNQISTIDFSKNLKLKKLDIGENSLTTLTVNQLEDLETLSCYKNQLTAINLLSNKKLISFIANDNQLTNVDIRANTNLTWIGVEDNNLAHLNVKNTNNTNFLIFNARGNTNLTCIEVDDVAYSESNWTQKDDSANFSGDCAPANDDCNFAIPLVINQETPGDINSGTFTNATDCVSGTVIADVWYTVTVPASGEFSIQGSGLGGLLKFAIYESCTSTSSISCGENISLTNLNSGDVYYLRVWMEEETSSKSSLKNSTAFGTFTLNVSDSSVLSTNNHILKDHSIVVYPNPASRLLNISSEKGLKEIEIFSIFGKRVLKRTVDNLKELSRNTSSYASGMYLLKINKKQLKKVIIN